MHHHIYNLISGCLFFGVIYQQVLVNQVIAIIIMVTIYANEEYSFHNLIDYICLQEKHLAHRHPPILHKQVVRWYIELTTCTDHEMVHHHLYTQISPIVQMV